MCGTVSCQGKDEFNLDHPRETNLYAIHCKQPVKHTVLTNNYIYIFNH